MLGRKTAYRDVVNRNIVCGLNEQNLEKAFFAHPTAFDVTVTLLLIKHGYHANLRDLNHICMDLA